MIITPHVAGTTSDASEVTMRFIKGQLARYAAGEPLLNIIGEHGYYGEHGY